MFPLTKSLEGLYLPRGSDSVWVTEVVYAFGRWKGQGVTEHIRKLGLQAIFFQSSKEEAKQKESDQTKVSQEGKCKNVLPRVNDGWQRRYNFNFMYIYDVNK